MCPKLVSWFLVLTMASSGVVFIEPAPFDILVVVFVIMFVASGQLFVAEAMYLPFGLLLTFLFFNIVSGMSSSDPIAMSKFLMITVFMTMVFACTSCVIYTWKDGLNVLLKGNLAASVIVACTALIMFFGFGYGSRVQGTFKDPNVFGPFLVLGVIYCISKIETDKRPSSRTLFYGCCAALLAYCNIVAGSRGGWFNLVSSLAAYVVIRVWQNRNNGRELFKTLLLPIIAGFIGVVCIVLVQYAEYDDFLTMRAEKHVYDEARFGLQTAAMERSASNVLSTVVGHGPGQFEVDMASTAAVVGSGSAHRLFVRLLFENGIGGFMSLMAFFGLSLIRGIRLAAKSWRLSPMMAVALACVIGGFVNSPIIDTVHWRHFWMQLGIIWGLSALYERESRAGQVLSTRVAGNRFARG